ncbi:hypothetical protein BCD93_002435 [Clostridium saccharoperbutylacetonicum]|nr:hypothetical protein [Clostridium saccharoperbutylacetonicum]
MYQDLNLSTSELETLNTFVSPSVKFIIKIAPVLVSVVGLSGLGTSFLVTLIVHDALKLLPSAVVAVIVQVPSLIALTFVIFQLIGSTSIVAIEGSLDFHVTPTADGVVIAVNLSESPIFKSIVDLSNVIDSLGFIK